MTFYWIYERYIRLLRIVLAGGPTDVVIDDNKGLDKEKDGDSI
jgi:hypothetical protein